MQCLKKRAAERPASARELDRLLQQVPHDPYSLSDELPADSGGRVRRA
jgi:hypothetical protein